jgi:hypothetical protein
MDSPTAVDGEDEADQATLTGSAEDASRLGVLADEGEPRDGIEEPKLPS